MVVTCGQSRLLEWHLLAAVKGSLHEILVLEVDSTVVGAGVAVLISSSRAYRLYE